ncbi:heterokaryon incompatibility protein-domain-containing protein [Xylariales sp. AK1849]|nr:heterokaryon incompatibility protein-domain-containing protein [Xylariales sp. AK1849]
MQTLDRHWIDTALLREWLDTCLHDHGERCRPLSARANFRPAWVIDVVEECLVPTKKSYQYMALSYVWGDTVASSQTTLSNLDNLQQSESMASTSSLVIPETIRHAMGLVNLLGYRYLWVDRFCICQDDAESKHTQINQMADIYENALLTIIAANGWDADHGLRGLKGVTQPRDLSPHLDMAEYAKLLGAKDYVWYSRGWTFQELYLSPRRLKFQYHTVVWECTCCNFCEGTGSTALFESNPIAYSLRITP